MEASKTADKRSSMVGRLVVALLALGAVAAPLQGARADWLSRLAREAGELGGRTARVSLGALDRPAAFLKSLPPSTLAGGVTLAAHATPEGHWRFANRAGDVFTAGTPEEMHRVVSSLAPEAAGGKLALYLTDESLLRRTAALKDLPSDARLHVVIGRDAFPVVRRDGAVGARFAAELRPNVLVPIFDERLDREALFQLLRPLDKARLRMLALTPGGPDALKSLPRYDAATKAALVDEIEPASLSRALLGVRGQTAVLTGRIDGATLHYRPATGAEASLSLSELHRAAAEADVNLILLHSPAPRQPGGRNWLWQRVAVAGLDEAMRRATFADFLDALGAGRGRLAVEATLSADGRTLMRVAPDGAASRPAAEQLGYRFGGWLDEIVVNVTGTVVSSAVEISARSAERQKELDARIVPGVPSLIQLGYGAALIAGLAGLPFSRAWWSRLWPAEQRAEYRSAAGYHGARLVRLAAFLVVFLPLAGPPALAATLAMQLWGLATVPARMLRWLTGLVRRHTTPASG